MNIILISSKFQLTTREACNMVPLVATRNTIKRRTNRIRSRISSLTRFSPILPAQNRIQHPLLQVDCKGKGWEGGWEWADSNIGGLLFQLSRCSSTEGIPMLFSANFARRVMSSRANTVHNFGTSGWPCEASLRRCQIMLSKI